MADERLKFQKFVRALSGVAAFAGLVGAGLVLTRTESGDSGSGLMARPRDAVIITQPRRLTSVLGLTLEEGVIHGADASKWRDAAPLSRLEIESGVFSLKISEPTADHSGTPADVTDVDRALRHLALFNVTVLAIKRSRVDIFRADGTPLRLNDVTADITTLRKDVFQAKGTARFRGTLVSFQADWSRPSDPKAAFILPLKLSVGGRALEMRVDGRLDLSSAPKLEGRGELKSPKLRVLARWLGLAVQPGHDLRKGSIAGDLNWSNGILSFANAKIALDGNEGTGAVSLALSQPRPKLDGTVAFDGFDVARYVETVLSTPVGGALDAVPEHQKSILSLIDADLRLSATKVKAVPLEAGRAALSVSVKNGRLHADIAEIEIEGGTANGQVTVDTASDDLRVGLKLRGRQIDPGRAMTDWMKRNPLLGRVNVSFEGQGSGTGLPDVWRKLAGRGTFELVEGGRLGLDLKALAHVAKTETATGWAAAGRGNTPLSAMDGRYQLSAGGIQFESITAKSGSETIIGTGRVDVVNRMIDLSVSIGAGSNAEVPVSNRDVLRLHGPWNEPLIGVHQAVPLLSRIPAVKGAVLDGEMFQQNKSLAPVSVDVGPFGPASRP